MRIKADELYARGLISQNMLYIDGKAYKIFGFDFDTQEYELVEIKKAS